MKKLLLILLLTLGLHAATTHTAKVLETLNSGGYTYIKVQEGSEVYWIAMTARQVKSGQRISYDEQGWMTDFYSKTLKRTFKKILFASDIAVTVPQHTETHVPDIMASSLQQKTTLSIAQLFAHRTEYAGKKVRVRAKVTKVSKGIMKRNWVHLQDGSRFQGHDDLVFTTTTETPTVGEVVTAEGVVVVDKDFGYGYFYPVIVESSTFKTK